MRYKILMFSLFLAWSLAVIGYFHKGAYGEEVRYYQIAEGNISQSIHKFWSEGVDGFYSVLKSDAEHAGRIRPGHWLYYNIPFALTLVRNGDMFSSAADVPLSQRINGDLQTHTLFLIFCLAMACALISYTTWTISSSFVPGILLPVYFATSLTVSENLIVYHCDSQEIPQLLFIAFYFFFITNLVLAQKNDIKNIIFACFFLILAYFTKETSLVLLPVFFATCFILWKTSESYSFKIGTAIVSQCILHLLLPIVLIFSVFHFREAEYSSTFYVLDFNIIDRYLHNFYYSWNDMTQGAPWPWMVCVCFLALGIIVKFSRKGFFLNHSANSLLLVCAFLLVLGFWVINIPWMQRMPKYYITPFFFMSLLVVLLQVVIYNSLKLHRFRVAGLIWLAGSSFFMLQSLDTHQERINSYYNKNYWVRNAIPLISRDVSRDIHEQEGIYHVMFIDDGKVRDGRLQLQRHLNLMHGINIAVQGNPVHRVHAHERNFFRINDDAPSVEVIMGSQVQEAITADYIYVLEDVFKEDDITFLVEMGYAYSSELNAGTDSPSVLKFTKI